MAVQKYFKKSEKKACQPSACCVKRESGATNRPPQPFKNISKKVKKNLQTVQIFNNPCQNLTKPMEKLMIKNVLNKFGFVRGFVRVAFIASVGFPLIFAANTFAQLPAPAQPAPAPAGGEAEVERVIVTGSNIPTAEETGPNPVDTYRPQDLDKLGIRTAQDLTNYLPQEAGGNVNLNIGNGGDGSVQLNLRGILPKETLVLIDGKRLASGSLGGAGTSGGVDVNLIPFVMVDHIDILKDGASAVYGADAVAGVVNFFLVHKFRGLEIGGTYGNSNLGGSNEMSEWEAWLKAGTGDDKTDIVVIADFWERGGGIFSRDKDISANGNFRAFGGFDERSGNFPGKVNTAVGTRRLIPSLFFGPAGTPEFGVNTPLPHSAPNAQTSPFYTSVGAVPGEQVPGLLGDGNFVAFNFAAFTPGPWQLCRLGPTRSVTRTVQSLVRSVSVSQSRIRLIRSRSRMRL